MTSTAETACEMIVASATPATDGAKHSRAEVIEHLHGHADEDDADIQLGEVDHVFRRTHDFQQRARGRKADDRQHCAAHKGQEHGGMHRFGDVFRVLRAGEARDEHVYADGKADKQADDHVIERTDRTDGRQRFIARKPADHDGIRRVEEQLQNAGEHNWKRKKQHLGQKGAFRHIHGAMRVGLEHNILLYTDTKRKNKDSLL